MNKPTDGLDFNLRLNDLMRAQYVERWHIVNTSRKQTVAEHSFNVTLLSKAIAEKMNVVVDDTLLLAALFHDIDEAVLGDIPTPAKDRYKKEGVKFPETTFVDWPVLPKEMKKVVKAADFLDAIYFLDDNGIGRHANAALDHLRAAWSRYKAANFTVDEIRILGSIEAELFSRGFTI